MTDEQDKPENEEDGAAEAEEYPAAEGAESDFGEEDELRYVPPSRDADFSQLDEGYSARAEEYKKEAADYKDKYLRALAELENYKKRTLKERSDLLKYQGDKILYDMVEIVDNFERALEHADADAAQLRSGVDLIYRMFIDTLSKWQVKAESAIGRQFDPVKHHALSKLALDDVAPGTVISELKKLYYFKDKLLRYGEVVVADRPHRDEASSGNVSGEARSDGEESGSGDEVEDIDNIGNDDDGENGPKSS